MQDEEFWASTPREVGALLHALVERDEAKERAATMRAGLVASAVYNVHRKRGSRAFQPEDFVRQPVRQVDGPTLRGIVRDWLGTRTARA